MKLSIPAIRALAYDPDGPSTQIHYFDELPGFGVRVSKGGAKSFVVWYRTTSGRKRMATLGRFGRDMTPEQAQAEALKTLADVRQGADPLEAKRAARTGATLKEFADVFMRDHRKKNGKRKKTAGQDRWRLGKYILPALGNRRLSDITRTRVRKFHRELGERSNAEANRCLALLSVMFRRASEWGYLPEDYPNPARGIEKYDIPKRDRWVAPDEMGRLAESIRAEESPYLRAVIWLYLLTGMRRGELLGLRWDDVKLDRAEIRLEDTKAGRPHTIPLSAPAVDILRDLPRQLSPYVFPSPKKRGAPLVNIDKPWRRVRKRAGLEDVRLHDLRRTVGSWLATSGASLHLIGSVLNHSSPSTTQVYARIADSAPRAALERHAEELARVVGHIG